MSKIDMMDLALKKKYLSLHCLKKEPRVTGLHID